MKLKIDKKLNKKVSRKKVAVDPIVKRAVRKPRKATSYKRSLIVKEQLKKENDKAKRSDRFMNKMLVVLSLLTMVLLLLNIYFGITCR